MSGSPLIQTYFSAKTSACFELRWQLSFIHQVAQFWCSLLHKLELLFAPDQRAVVMILSLIFGIHFCVTVKFYLTSQIYRRHCTTICTFVCFVHLHLPACVCVYVCVCVYEHAFANTHSWRRREDRSVHPLGNYGAAAGILHWWSSCREREKRKRQTHLDKDVQRSKKASDPSFLCPWSTWCERRFHRCSYHKMRFLHYSIWGAVFKPDGAGSHLLAWLMCEIPQNERAV